MKIIVSPSKTQHFQPLENRRFSREYQNLTDVEKKRMDVQKAKTATLVKTIRETDEETLAKKMKIKGKLLESAIDQYEHFDDNITGPAVFSYTGTVFKEIEVDFYHEEQFEYMAEHLMVLSALYGPVPSFFDINPYRLDMKVSLLNVSLYSFWKDDCEAWFADENLIIDLASKEFSKMVKGNKLQVEFLQTVSGKKKAIAYHSKQARGWMLNYLIENCIDEPEKMKNFDVGGYKFDAELSSESKYVFVR